jgi:hypothetical protein
MDGRRKTRKKDIENNVRAAFHSTWTEGVDALGEVRTVEPCVKYAARQVAGAILESSGSNTSPHDQSWWTTWAGAVFMDGIRERLANAADSGDHGTGRAVGGACSKARPKPPPGWRSCPLGNNTQSAVSADARGDEGGTHVADSAAYSPETQASPPRRARSPATINRGIDFCASDTSVTSVPQSDDKQGLGLASASPDIYREEGRNIVVGASDRSNEIKARRDGKRHKRRSRSSAAPGNGHGHRRNRRRRKS